MSEPTTYLGNSLKTVWKEAQAARAGVARLNPEAFAGWKITLRAVHLVDLREARERKKWDVKEAEVVSDPAPPRLKEIARSLRRSKEKIDGLIYKSVRNPPDGVCVAIFLEREDVVARFERVPKKEWKDFVAKEEA